MTQRNEKCELVHFECGGCGHDWYCPDQQKEVTNFCPSCGDNRNIWVEGGSIRFKLIVEAPSNYRDERLGDEEEIVEGG